jgi:2-polyprenyl-3-methyl-5-hydroxy-6-metoxy-1,4-benzoquinol methylase
MPIACASARTTISKDITRPHDELARFTLDTLWPISLRGRTVADIGCGGGSLLDHIKGLPLRLLAIDPAQPVVESLMARGYAWYPSAEAAALDHAGRVDVAFSIQAIEHVDNPLSFLRDIRRPMDWP